MIAVVEEPEGGQQWLQLRPFTSVRGAAASRVDALRSGQRVYVRYLREAERELPEVLSVTVLTYTLPPRGGGPGSFGLPSF